ncbi:MAG: chalcone isomerase family protein [Deltaproteobacteria bacterium]|jgi:hypothetical protein|nr:chalcone isomerase family protein [Deltaproteobacteria bacterium]
MKRVLQRGIGAAAVFILAAFVLLAAGRPAIARVIAGVDVPPTVTLGSEELVLNGAGIRVKLFMKIYVGALYLKARQTSVDAVLSDPGAKRIVMNFLYKELSTKKLVDAWNTGFTNNSTPAEVKALQERITRFNAMFDTVHRGDVIRLDYLPDAGTQVWINDTLKGTVAGEDFSRALLRIWLGPKPPDVNLKNAMMGNAY